MASTALSMPGFKRRDEGQRQDEAREGQKDIRQAHQDSIDDAAEIAGDTADGEADRGDQHDDGDDHAERDAAAIEQARIDIAAKLVGAEPMGGAWSRQAVCQLLRCRIMVASKGAKIASATNTR
jgi:hypothetical protein